uniref:Uncharacterized protein n=1 Tax=Pavo cristatus TaxID=9049 RepID=A0A8C9FSB1_PAVCR
PSPTSATCSTRTWSSPTTWISPFFPSLPQGHRDLRSLPSSLSSSLSNPSLPTSPRAQPVPGSPSHPSLPSFSPLVPAPVSTSPRRRVPLSPLTLPMGGDARRQHPKQFSPTMSPTLSSIAQGVPLDTSKLPADHRLPPYPYSQPGLVLPSPQQKVPAQPPPLPPGPAARPHGPPGAAPQRCFAPQFQPDAPALQQPPAGQHGPDFGLGSVSEAGTPGGGRGGGLG